MAKLHILKTVPLYRITDDSSFDTYMRDALSNDIKVGAYFFSQALTKDEAVEEADYVISKLKPYNVTCPVAIDVEEVNAGSSRQNTLTNEKWYAFYADVPYMPYEFSMWQYTNTGSVDGISGNVDLNISFKSWN